MKPLFYILLFLLGSKTQSFGQKADKGFDNCEVLEKIVNDSAVKRYLFTRERFIGFQRSNSCFANCHSVLINGKSYHVADSAVKLNYTPVYIYASPYSTQQPQGKENKNTFWVTLDYGPQEQGALIKIDLTDGVYRVKLEEIISED